MSLLKLMTLDLNFLLRFPKITADGFVGANWRRSHCSELYSLGKFPELVVHVEGLVPTWLSQDV